MVVSSSPWLNVVIRVGVGMCLGLAGSSWPCLMFMRPLSSLLLLFLWNPGGEGKHILEDALTRSWPEMLRGFWGNGFVIINSVRQTTRLVRSFHSSLELCVAQNRIIVLLFVLAVKY